MVSRNTRKGSHRSGRGHCCIITHEQVHRLYRLKVLDLIYSKLAIRNKAVVPAMVTAASH